MAVCLNHTDTEAVTRCCTCGKPLCAKCVIQKGDADYCSESCAEKGRLAGKRSSDVITNTISVETARRIRNFIIFIIILAILGGGAWYYSQNKKEVDKKLDKLSKQAEEMKKTAEEKLKKHSSASEKAVNDKIPDSSKYKRHREGLVE